MNLRGKFIIGHSEDSRDWSIMKTSSRSFNSFIHSFIHHSFIHSFCCLSQSRCQLYFSLYIGILGLILPFNKNPILFNCFRLNLVCFEVNLFLPSAFYISKLEFHSPFWLGLLFCELTCWHRRTVRIQTFYAKDIG